MDEETLMTQTAATSRFQFRLKQVKNLFGAIFRSKRGAFGVVIIVFFSLVALLAPIIAPHDPVNDVGLAGRFAAPAWYPMLFGGTYSENMYLLSDPLFDTSYGLSYWRAPSDNSINISWTNFTGIPRNLQGKTYNDLGCLLFNLTDPSSDNLTVTFLVSFNYSYTAPPERVRLSFYYLAKAVELSPVNVTVSIYQPNSATPLVLLDAPRSASARIYSTTKQWAELYVESKAERAWVDAYLGPDVQDPTRYIFPTQGQYKIELKMDFSRNPELEPGKVFIFIDNFQIKLYGTVYGLLGTDQVGRDVYSQLIWGSRLSLFVGLLAAVVSVALGLMFGLIAGYIGGAADETIMRITDVLLTLPGLPLMLVLMTVLGASLWNLIILIGFLGWMGFARTVRSVVLSVKERPFIEAAKAAGAGSGYIMIRHIIPNVMGLVYVSLATSVPGAILSEAALSFLGLYDPSVMTWGRMLHDVETSPVGVKMWWWALPPGLGIAAISLSFILIGYALDEILNPRLRQRR